MNSSMKLLALFALAAGCTDGTEPEPYVCDDASGNLCTWIGIPETAMFAAEGLNRLESATYLPQDGVFDADGNFYFIDFNNHRIRKVDATDGSVNTIAGNGFLGDGYVGPEGAQAFEADALDFAFNHPTDLAFHPLDDNLLYVAAWHNSRITVIDLAAGRAHFECGTGARNFGGDGGPAIASFLDLPSSLAFEDDGAFYIMDQANQVIRHVANDENHTITTYAGVVETRQVGTTPEGNPVMKTAGFPGYSGDGGTVAEARFYASTGQAADPSSRITLVDGFLYIADTENHLIRRIDTEAGTVEHIGGFLDVQPYDHDFNVNTPDITSNRGVGYSGDGGPATEAKFFGPRDLEVDGEGNVIVADTMNHCVRKIDTAGIVTTIAGKCGQPGFSGDGTPATEALLNRPFGVEIGPDGAIIIADTGNHVFRRISP